MKKFKFLMIALAAAMMVGSCSDDNIDVKGGTNTITPDAKDGVFFAVNIDLPTGGRSRSVTDDPKDGYSTSDNGVEVGKDYENYVGEVIVVLATNPTTPTAKVPVNGFIAAATVPTKNVTSVAADKAAYKLLTSLTLTDLASFYDELPNNWTDFKCNIYVFANPGQKIKDILFGSDTNKVTAPSLLDANWVNSIVELQGVPTTNIANKAGNSNNGSFLMSNATIAVREIPSSVNDWRHYTTEANPFDLSGDNHEVTIDNGVMNGRGNIKLERAAARFDFRDGSPVGNFTYHVVKGDAGVEGVAESNLIDIKLSNMSLVNVNKKFYALRRVANFDPTTTQLSNTIICGPEYPWQETEEGKYTGGNYVVDADFDWKTQLAKDFNSATPPTTGIPYATHFFYPLFTENDAINNANGAKNWFTDDCAKVIEGEEDNDEGWTQTPLKGDYRIWTYASENTIVGIDYQKNGISTGVVFKGQMVATEAALNSNYPDVKALAEAIANPKTSDFLFVFGGNIYLNWSGIRDAAITAAVSGIKWVPATDAENETNGTFEFTAIDRSNSLYVAVFGNGGFGTIDFTYTEYDVDTKKPITDAAGNVIQHKGTITDTLEESSDCADAKWKAYAAATSTSALNAFKSTAVDAKITIYQPSEDNGPLGYYCYYYYWNRHNNNGKPGIMGPMEFAVVRNNVYKLAVTNIKQLGHPRNSLNDPDKPTGGTDDETEDAYITVTAEVLPWVVRVNDIEF